VPRRRLPLQVVETVNSPRANKDTLFDPSASRGPATVGDQGDGWRNRLIWGDNLHVLSSLTEEFAGQIDLVYIDPPFDSRQDYKVRIGIGDGAGGVDEELAKISSIVEEKAYRDTWGSGVDSYLQMLYQRIVLLRELLSDRGSLFLHLAPNVSHYARAVLDEVFGPENFRAEIIWQRVTAHSDTKDFGWIHDSILCFAKSDTHSWNPQFRPYDESYIKSHYSHRDANGRRYLLDNLTSPNPRPNMTYAWCGHEPPAYGWRYSVETMTRLHDEGRIWYPADKSKRPRLKRYLDDMPGMPLGDVWDDIHPVNSQAQERLGYDTQKPEALLERIIRSSSDEGSIVLDCFAGSGTTAAVAEKLGRRWIAVDVGRFAIHTTRKRLLDIKQCKPFVVANLGRYERQVWQAATTGEEFRAYLDFIVQLYGATPAAGFSFVHGTLGKRAVHVGAVDAAVSQTQVKDAIDEARAAGYFSLDVLGWEFELGLHEIVREEAKAAGVNLLLRRIPNEVMDPRTVAADEVVFHELAHVKIVPEVKKNTKTLVVRLTDFALPNPELVSDTIRDRIQSWSDYIDYWAVDFTFGSQPDDEHGPDTFRNSWQSYRTKANRSLDLTARHDYEFPGKYTVLVKVVDVFGNDTTTSVPVTVT
jgi:adenine specific DNA methylase Mod